MSRGGNSSPLPEEGQPADRSFRGRQLAFAEWVQCSRAMAGQVIAHDPAAFSQSIKALIGILFAEMGWRVEDERKP